VYGFGYVWLYGISNVSESLYSEVVNMHGAEWKHSRSKRKDWSNLCHVLIALGAGHTT
jgi:hypothetical protein